MEKSYLEIPKRFMNLFFTALLGHWTKVDRGRYKGK